MRAAAIAFVAVVVMGSSADSAELIVLSGQGATPGVREVAAAFARTSGHTVTVLQPASAELQQEMLSRLDRVVELLEKLTSFSSPHYPGDLTRMVSRTSLGGRRHA